MNEMKKDFWVNQVLEEIAHGELLDAALAKVPEEVLADVRAVVEAALWLQRDARPTLQEAAERWQPAPFPIETLPSSPSRWKQRLELWASTARLGIRPLIAALTLLMLALFTWQTARAASTALPGEWAYPIKRASERVRYLLTPNPGDRLKLTLDFANQRLQEAATARQRHQKNAEEESLRLYAQDIQAALQTWKNLPPLQQQTARPWLLSTLRHQTQILQTFSSHAPGKVWQNAQRALQAMRQHVVNTPATIPLPATPRHPPTPSQPPSSTMVPTAVTSTTPTPPPTITHPTPSAEPPECTVPEEHSPYTPTIHHTNQPSSHPSDLHTSTPSVPKDASHHSNRPTTTPSPAPDKGKHK